MKKYFLILIILFLLTLPLSAQNAPRILSFTYDGIPLTYDLVEQGVASSDFSWEAVYVTAPFRMQMHAFVGGQWALIGEDFEPAKSDRLVIAHPLSFSMPSYRLSIVNAEGVIVDEAHLRLAYADSDPDGATHLINFSTTATSVSRQELINGSALLDVSWNARNRIASTNIVFEQVLPDGTWQSIELRRFENWVRSFGAGVVAPVNVAGEDEIRIQARVFDVVTGDSLSTIQLVIPINNDVIRPAPTIEPTETDIPLNQQVTFDAPYLVMPGDDLTLSWDATATASVADEVIIREWHRIDYTGKYSTHPTYFDNDSDTPVNEWTGLALSGQITVPAPAEFPESSMSYRDFQNAVVYALYLSKDGVELRYDYPMNDRFNVQQAVFLRTVEQATNCEPTLTVQEQVIAGDPLPISWDFCGVPYVGITFSPQESYIYHVVYGHMPKSGAGTIDYSTQLFDGEDAIDVTVIVENSFLDYRLEATVRIVRE